MSQNPDEPRSRLLERDFEQLLAAAFERAGWKAERIGANGPAALVRHGKLRYAVELKVAREPRRALIQAMFADAVLRAGVHARELRAEPLAVVAAPRISSALAAESIEYARRFAPGVAFGLLDARGRFELHGRGLDDVRADAKPRAAPSRPAMSPRRSDPFSDLGQWILKVLLAEHLPPELIGAPREPIDNLSQLGKAASVSLASVSRLVAQFRRLGFVEAAPRSLKLVRIADLLRDWRQANAALPVEVPARWLLPPKDGAAQLDRALHRFVSGAIPSGERDRPFARWKGPRAALGLFAAGAKLGFRFVQGAPLHLYLEDVSSGSLEQLGLSLAHHGEQADVIVRQPRFPEALFRACVAVDGVPVADILQCWLDVSGHPARGEEYAERIWRRVLAPRLLEQQ